AWMSSTASSSSSCSPPGSSTPLLQIRQGLLRRAGDRGSRTELERELQGSAGVCLLALLREETSQVVVAWSELSVQLHRGSVIFQSGGLVPFSLAARATPHVEVGTGLLRHGFVQKTEALVEGLELVV